MTDISEHNPAFEQAIRERPGDVGLLHVYADWYLEHGNQKAYDLLTAPEAAVDAERWAGAPAMTSMCTVISYLHVAKCVRKMSVTSWQWEERGPRQERFRVFGTFEPRTPSAVVHGTV